MGPKRKAPEAGDPKRPSTPTQCWRWWIEHATKDELYKVADEMPELRVAARRAHSRTRLVAEWSKSKQNCKVDYAESFVEMVQAAWESAQSKKRRRVEASKQLAAARAARRAIIRSDERLILQYLCQTDATLWAIFSPVVAWYSNSAFTSWPFHVPYDTDDIQRPSADGWWNGHLASAPDSNYLSVTRPVKLARSGKIKSFQDIARVKVQLKQSQPLKLTHITRPDATNTVKWTYTQILPNHTIDVYSKQLSIKEDFGKINQWSQCGRYFPPVLFSVLHGPAAAASSSSSSSNSINLEGVAQVWVDYRMSYVIHRIIELKHLPQPLALIVGMYLRILE